MRAASALALALAAGCGGGGGAFGGTPVEVELDASLAAQLTRLQLAAIPNPAGSSGLRCVDLQGKCLADQLASLGGSAAKNGDANGVVGVTFDPATAATDPGQLLSLTTAPGLYLLLVEGLDGSGNVIASGCVDGTGVNVTAGQTAGAPVATLGVCVNSAASQDTLRTCRHFTFACSKPATL